MNARLFWKALVVQAIVVAIPFAILGLALSEDFFEDWGWLVGPGGLAGVLARHRPDPRDPAGLRALLRGRRWRGRR